MTTAPVAKRSATAAGAVAKQPRRSLGGEVAKPSVHELAVAAALRGASEDALPAETRELLLAVLPGTLAQGHRHELQDRMLRHVAAGLEGIDARLERVAEVAVAEADEVLDQQRSLKEAQPQLEATASERRAAVAETAARMESEAATAAAMRPRIAEAEAALRTLDAALGTAAMEAVSTADGGQADAALTAVVMAKARERLAVVGSIRDAQASLETATAQRQTLGEALLDLKVDQENDAEAVRAGAAAMARCEAEQSRRFEAVYRAQAALLAFRSGPQKALDAAAKACHPPSIEKQAAPDAPSLAAVASGLGA